MLELKNLMDVARESFPPLSFSDFAADALGRLSSSITPEACLNYFNSHPKCRQTYAGRKFSSEDYTLFCTDDFALDLYVWRKQDTSIHDHAFEGAFLVLEGQNLQIEFDFESLDPSEIQSSKSWNFGNLQPRGRGVQNVGAIQKIGSGAGFIHQVVHLTPVVVTLCLRTIKPSTKPAHVYFYPDFRLRTSWLLNHQAEDLKAEPGLDTSRLERTLETHREYISAIDQLKS